MSPLHPSTCMLYGTVQTRPNWFVKPQLAIACPLPSSVWGFLSAVDFKLLARPLDLMVAACFLCIHALLSVAEHPQQAFFLGIERDRFCFYAFQCRMMCIYPCFLFRDLCTKSTTPMNSGKCPPQAFPGVVNDFPEAAC